MKIELRKTPSSQWYFVILKENKNILRSRSFDSKKEVDQALFDVWQFFTSIDTTMELLENTKGVG